MAAKIALSSALIDPTKLHHHPFVSSKPSSGIPASRRRTSIRQFKISAQLGGGGGEESKKGEKKKFITREQEPEQYWQTAGERKGENPMMTPLPYIIIFGMSTPFVILALGFANGWIKVPVR